jgi:hypothetical protein
MHNHKQAAGAGKKLFFVSGLLFAYSKFSAQQYLPLQGPYKYQSISSH